MKLNVEHIISGLKHHEIKNCQKCPYFFRYEGIDDLHCYNVLLKDARQALCVFSEDKAFLPLEFYDPEEKITTYSCPKCDTTLNPDYEFYCSTCGTKIDWPEDK